MTPDAIAAHNIRFAGLPLISVPSAAITDQQVNDWSAQDYEHDLNRTEWIR